MADFGYFFKRTNNAYDFGVLFDTPIVFPISWDHSKIDGFTGEINLVEHHGFSAFIVMGHTSAIFSPPGNGGILIGAGDWRLPDRPRSEVQPDDQLQYIFAKPIGAWAALNWRYDSGLVAGSVASIDDALALDGRSAGGDRVLLRQYSRDPRSADYRLSAPVAAPRACESRPKGPRTMWTIRRESPRDICSISVFGVDNLFHTDKAKVRVRFSVVNVDQQRGAVQLPVDVQRHAFRDAARVPVAAGRGFLRVGRSSGPAAGVYRDASSVFSGTANCCVADTRLSRRLYTSSIDSRYWNSRPDEA